MANIRELINAEHAHILARALQTRLQAVKPTDKGGSWGDTMDITITGIMDYEAVAARAFRVMIAGQSDLLLKSGESVEIGANGKSLVFASNFGDCSLAMDYLLYCAVPYNMQANIMDYLKNGYISEHDTDFTLSCFQTIVDYTVVIAKHDFFSWIDSAEDYYKRHNTRAKKLLRIVKSSARSVNSYYQIRGETDSALEALYEAGKTTSRYTYTGYNLWSLKSYLDLNF